MSFFDFQRRVVTQLARSFSTASVADRTLRRAGVESLSGRPVADSLAFRDAVNGLETLEPSSLEELVEGLRGIRSVYQHWNTFCSTLSAGEGTPSGRLLGAVYLYHVPPPLLLPMAVLGIVKPHLAGFENLPTEMQSWSLGPGSEFRFDALSADIFDSDALNSRFLSSKSQFVVETTVVEVGLGLLLRAAGISARGFYAHSRSFPHGDASTRGLAIEVGAGAMSFSLGYRESPPELGALIKYRDFNSGVSATLFPSSQVYSGAGEVRKRVRRRIGATLGGDGLRVEFVDAMTELRFACDDGAHHISATVWVNTRLDVSSSLLDRFSSTISPSNLELSFDFGIGFDTQRGLMIFPRGNLSYSRSVVGSPLKRVAAEISVDASVLRFDVSGDVFAELGPVSVLLSGIGPRFSASRAPTGGVFGTLDFDGLEVALPSAAAVDIRTELLAAQGMLYSKNRRFVGAMRGTVQRVEVGILAVASETETGFSFLIVLSAEFPAIQLGFGFTLSGVGGIGGINRRSDPDFFQAGLRSGTLDSIMFPKNVIENASKVVADVAHAFPVAEDNYVFGPMLKMGWGTPKVLSAEIAVILDFPAPLKVLLLGQISMTLPNNKKKGSSARTPISINLDVFGELDITNKFFQLDGVLHDSYVGPYSISGDMAMRMSWGERAEFLLSIGGFHPRFDPPPQIPALQRVRFDVGTGNPRIGAEAYFALTSNTAQVGSRVDVYAKKFGFSASAQAGFDALFIFEPFQFIVDIFLSVAIRRGSRHILSADLDLTLSGPRPWRAKGKVEFRIFFKFKIPFDLTFGSSRAPELPRVDVMTPLITAISDPKNWSTEVATVNRNSVIALRDVGPDAERLAHPLSDLSFRQQVLPMQFQFERFGAGVPVDDRGTSVNRIEVNAVELGDTPLAYHPTKEKFAPGEFLELTEDQKLSRPSFEDFAAGAAVIGTRDYVFQERANGKTTVTSVEQTYEQSVIDETTKLPNRAGVTTATSSRMAQALSSMGGDVTGATGFYRSRPIGISVSPETYVVADKNRVPVPGAPESTYTEAQQFAAAQNLDMADHQIILLHEKAA